MYDHIGLKVASLDTSVRFYLSALGGFGYVKGYADDTVAGLGPKDAAGLWLYASKGPAGPGVHVAFKAPNRAAVDAFHRDGLKAGGRDNGAPGIRADYSPNYYAAFLIDPDGNNVEAVCYT
jgi:catechol 2,3-dioxygenase-like lactoylglutathione lyase family enzyme